MQRSAGSFDLVQELLVVLAVAALAGALAFAGERVWRRLAGGRRAPSWAGWAVVGGGVAAYLGTVGALAIARHDALKSHAYDLGIFTQVLWNTSQGRWFENTVMVEYAENLLGQHFAPVFLLLVPLYWVWPDARALLWLQSAALAVAALPLYDLARRRTQSQAAGAVLALAYLATPAVHFVNFYDFHEIALVVPLLLAALAFADRDRKWAATAFAAATLLCREEMGLVVAAFGVWLLVRRAWGPGLVLAVVGPAWTAAAVWWIVPYFQQTRDYYFVVRYAELGGSVGEIATTLATRPAFVWEYLTTGALAGDRLAYVLRLLGPTGLLSLAGPQILVLGVPTLGYLLLSNYKEQFDIVNQYSAPLLPFIWAATAAAVGLVARRWPKAAVPLAAYALAAAAVSSVQFGPTPFGRRHDAEQFAMTEHARLGHEVMARIPPGASVSTQSDLVPHLAHRREIYLFPNVHAAEYVLVDNWTDRWPLTEGQWTQARDEMLANPLYTLVYTEGGYGLFKRAPSVAPQIRASVSYLNKIEMLGVDLPPRVVRPGESVELGVYWRAMTPIAVRRVRDRFVTSVKLLRPDGGAALQVDKEPWDGLVSTDRMIQGEIIRERYRFTIPADAPAGDYAIATGMYSFYSKRPLAIFDEAGARTEAFEARVAVLPVSPR